MSRLLSLLLVVIGTVLVVGIILTTIFWFRVPTMLSRELSQKMDVRVKISTIGLTLDDISVNNLKIDNLPGSILPTAFTSKTIDLHAPIGNYLHDHIVINEIDVDDIYLGLEFNSPSGTTGNWAQIMGNLQRSQDKASSSSSKLSKRTVFIKKIVLTNLNVDVVYKTDKKVKRLPTIDRMELTDISSEGGFPSDQIMNSVLGQMLKSVFVKENMNNMLQDLLKQENPVNKFLQPFQGLFNAQEDEKDPDAA